VGQPRPPELLRSDRLVAVSPGLALIVSLAIGGVVPVDPAGDQQDEERDGGGNEFIGKHAEEPSDGVDAPMFRGSDLG
jgi:hypothetical protein